MFAAEFESWLDCQGVKLHGLAVAEFDGVRGVIAERNVQEGTTCIRFDHQAANVCACMLP